MCLSGPESTQKENGVSGNGKESDVKKGNANPAGEGAAHKRDQWNNKAEFLLSCIGLAVGIGNVWRFPYLAYQNGGGAFLLAYAVLLVLVGKPVFFMELAIGQFAGVSPVGVWRCFPLAKGVGIAMVIMSILVSIYYNVIMSYTLYYAGQSLRSQVPWKECSDWWGADETCYVSRGKQVECAGTLMVPNSTLPTNISSYDSSSNATIMTDDMFQPLCTAVAYNGSTHMQTASEQFWERYVLQLTDGISNLGSLKWDLTLTLFVCWVIVALGLIKGIKSSGKVVYVTAVFPYVVLISLVIYGCTLDGAINGIKYFFVPEWKRLLEIQVWRAAAEQMVFTMSLGFGCLIMYSSYNDFHNKLYKDAIFISSLDFLTSIMAGVVILSVLGNLSHEMGVDIDKVAKGGQGLAFVTYPEALARLPFSQLWSALFFIMLFTLAIDSQFSYLETYFTAIFDRYPHLKPKKALITFASCMLFFVCGLPCVTQGGQYVFNLMDVFAGGYACLFVVTAELITITWLYGAEKFAGDIEFMLGSRPGTYCLVCWKYISPPVLLFVLIYGMSVHKPITYNSTPYPTWAEAMGWILMFVSVIQIPLWAIVEFIRLRKKGRSVLKPHPDWGPADPDIRLKYQLQIQEKLELDEEINGGVVNIAMDCINADDR